MALADCTGWSLVGMRVELVTCGRLNLMVVNLVPHLSQSRRDSICGGMVL